MVSLPAPPSSMLLPALPVSVLSSVLPVALMAADPVSGQVLDVGAERVADAALHGVGALAGSLGDHVAGRVDHIGVVAGAADHGVVAGAAVEHVVAGVAGQRVVERVAGGVDGCRAGQRQVLDIGAERVADAALHGVGALPGQPR